MDSHLIDRYSHISPFHPEFQTETQNYVDETDKVADVYDNSVQAKRNATKAKLQADAKGGKKAGV